MKQENMSQQGHSDDESTRNRDPESVTTGLSRRSTLGVTGLVGLAGLGSVVGTASAGSSASGDVSFGDTALVDVGGLHGSSLTGGQQLDSLVGDNLTIENGALTAVGGGSGGIDGALEQRLNDAVTRLEVVGGTANQWRAGPSSPSGTYHYTGAFGMLFETDRPVYLGECTIDANKPGQFTAALYEYDSSQDTLGKQVDTITIQASGGPQTVFLDFLAAEPGEYLLTRLLPEQDPGDNGVPDDIYKPADDGELELKRSGGYGRYSGDSQDGVTFKGGYNPYYSGISEPTTEYYYYYFDLEVSSARA